MDSASRKRLAISLGLKDLSEKAYAKLNIQKALDDRRRELKAVKDAKSVH